MIGEIGLIPMLGIMLGILGIILILLACCVHRR